MPGRVSCQSGPDCRYKFTAKERDTETNYDYFGARYYDARIGRWLQVDPLGEKYPSLGLYVYTANNPLLYLDIDGRQIITRGDRAKRRHELAMEKSPTYKSLVKEINKILVEIYGIEIPLDLDKTSSEIKEKAMEQGGEPVSRIGTLFPGLSNNVWVVEGTEIWISKEISTENLAKKSTEKTMAHELQHLLDFIKDPKGYMKEVKKEQEKPHAERTHEIRAKNTAEKVNKEIYPNEYEIRR